MSQSGHLRKELFWDVDAKEIDLERNTDFVISRILNYGNEEDYKTAVKIYGIDKIKETAKKICYSNNKSRNFWSNMFNIPLNLFGCKKKSLNQKQSMFLRK